MFFWSWEIWAKMAFVLGCLITMVVTLAGIVKLSKTQKSHRLASKLAEQDAEKAQMTPITQLVEPDEEIQFGLSAMEDPLEIEGLWNSQTTTPLHTPILSPKRSRDSSPLRLALEKLTISRRASSQSPGSKGDTSESRKRLPSESNLGVKVALSSACPETQIQERSINNRRCIRISHPATLDILQPDLEQSRILGSGIEPVQFDDFTALATPRNDIGVPLSLTVSTENKATSVESPYLALRKASDNPLVMEAPNRSRTIVIGGPPCEETAKLIRTASTLRNLEVLDQMEAHRRYHAAESGQLLPRTRRVLNDSLHRDTTSLVAEVNAYFHETPRSVSWPTRSEEVVVSMKTPKRPERRVSPSVVPFRAFVEMHPPPQTCPSAWTIKTQDMMDEVLDIMQPQDELRAASHGSSHSESSSESIGQTESPSRISIYNTTTREANNGFEILPAGTLEREAVVKSLGRSSDNLQDHMKGAKRPAKLQKRGRARSRGSQSSNDEQKIGKENIRATVF